MDHGQADLLGLGGAFQTLGYQYELPPESPSVCLLHINAFEIS